MGRSYSADLGAMTGPHAWVPMRNFGECDKRLLAAAADFVESQRTNPQHSLRYDIDYLDKTVSDSRGNSMPIEGFVRQVAETAVAFGVQCDVSEEAITSVSELIPKLAREYIVLAGRDL